MQTEPKVNKNAVQAVYDQIMENIVHFVLKPGEVVTENSLAEKFNLGRTPVREALKRLEVEGLITTEGRTKKIYYLSPKDIEDIFNIKIIMESYLAKLAAEKASDEQMNRLSNIMLGMKSLGAKDITPENNDQFLSEWLILDVQFHDLLFEMADNMKIVPIIKNLNIQWHRLKVGITAIEGRIEKAISEHCTIGNAILARNGGLASSEIATHLESLKVMILKMMQMFG